MHGTEVAGRPERWHEAWGVALGARLVATRRFLAGHDAAWMEAQAARGNTAEALHVYERLRVLLREELGVAPGPAVQAVHRRLLLGAAD